VIDELRAGMTVSDNQIDDFVLFYPAAFKPQAILDVEFPGMVIIYH
jgi:hypothetical protein